MKKVSLTFLTLFSISFFLILTNLNAQYNYGLDVCDQDAKIEGKLNLNDGNSNVLIGSLSGTLNTTGFQNTFVGVFSGQQNMTGFQNTFLGAFAGQQNTTSSLNTFIGNSSGKQTTTGANNTFLGALSGQSNTTGFQNTFIGMFAGAENTTGQSNIYIGNSAGSGNSIGSKNTLVGSFAGTENTSGEGNIFIGYTAGFFELGSDKLYIENSNSSSPLIYGEFDTDEVTINGDLCYTGTLSACSDLRFKKNIKPIAAALNKIKKINGVSHEWKQEEFQDKVWKNGIEYGVIAQEVQKVFPHLVNEDEEGYLYVDYSKLTPILLEAIKEQQKIIERLEEQHLVQETRINQLQLGFKLLEKLEARVKNIEHKENSEKDELSK